MLIETFLTVLTLLSLRATVSHGFTVSPPHDVHFKSHNLQNTVEWSPGPGALNGTRYTVEFAIYGEEDENAPDQEVWKETACKKVSRTWCDLSTETSNLEEKYYARVRALGKNGPSEWAHTERFDPRLDTTFGPPAVNIMVKERHMFINLKGPMKWRKKSTSQEFSMAKFYPQMLYNLSVYNNRTKQTSRFLLDNSSYELGLLDFGTQYCVVASAYFSSLPFKTQPSKRECVTTAKDPTENQMLLLILGGILPLVIVLLIVVLVGFPLYHYVFGHKQKHPPNLLVPHLPDLHVKLCTDMLSTVNLIKISSSVLGMDLGCGKAEGTLRPALPPVHQSETEKLLAPTTSLYAAQHMTHEEDMEAKTMTQLMAHSTNTAPSETSDYGIVLKAQGIEPDSEATAEDEHQALSGAPDTNMSGALNGSTVQATTGYNQQWQSTDTCFQEEEEGTVVNWDRETGKLQIPLLFEFEPEPELRAEERPELDQMLNILSKVYIRQSSRGSNETEDDLTKMENNWALQVNM